MPRTKAKKTSTLAGFALALSLSTGWAAHAQTPAFSVLHTFTGADGAFPSYAMPLTQDSGGNLYGVTSEGGDLSSEQCDFAGCGVVYKLSPATGSETVVYAFTGESDGSRPSSVILDPKGNLYGVTSQAGGTIFKLTPAGAETTLYAFPNSTTGYDPVGGLVGDPMGNLYGTAPDGGTIGATFGVAFELAPNGAYTVLHDFSLTDGSFPYAALVRDRAGNLYGTTLEGGPSEQGVVFKLDPSGLETVLHDFTGADGSAPESPLILDAAGNLYGVTPAGGKYNNGVVFEMGATGTFSVLYNFTGGADGGSPGGKLLRDATTGTLYGTAGIGGNATGSCSTGCGVLFQLEVSGRETVLYAFTGLADGKNPSSGLIATTAAGVVEFFGTAEYGGEGGCLGNVTGCGTVYKLTLGP
jgi:uncharacterized repeat protein (TIGR03803 family)